MITCHSTINALINMINGKKYSEDYTRKTNNIKEINLLLAPFFVDDNNVKNFRDKFIIEFYKKFLENSSISLCNNYLYYSLIIGLVNAYSYQDVKLAVEMKTPSREHFWNEHRNVMPFPPSATHIRQMFITYINEKIFYMFNFDSFSNRYLLDLNNIDHETYMKREYPEIYKLMIDINNADMRKAIFPIILHFIYITNILDISKFKNFECMKVIKHIEEKEEEEKTIDINALFNKQRTQQ